VAIVSVPLKFAKSNVITAKAPRGIKRGRESLNLEYNAADAADTSDAFFPEE